MIDYWTLTKDFKAGDTVQRFAPGAPTAMSPFVGRVTHVHRGLGVIDVQFPYGVDRIHSDELIKVNPAVQMWLPPTLDQTYSSYDTSSLKTARTKLAQMNQSWRTTELPAGFHSDLAKLWSRSASEVDAYDQLWRRYSSLAEDYAIRAEVGKFYQFAQNLVDLRINQHVAKTAAYWASSNRQYRATSGELLAKKPSCPKCGTSMKKTTYKMREGARERLFACPRDLFLLKQTDILGPDGQPVAW